MDFDIKCGDFLLANKARNVEADLESSCDKFFKQIDHQKPKVSPVRKMPVKCETPPGDFITSSSSLSSISSGLLPQGRCSTKEHLMKVPNISYELSVAKTVMQELSSISGDNLFDHLSDIIKRVIDERPPNVIDFFEEFSRNVREQKLHLPERFPPSDVFEEHRLYKVAKKQLNSMQLPYVSELLIQDEDELEAQAEGSKDGILEFDLKHESLSKFKIFNDRVQYLQFFWNQCGFSISSEDIFQLACSMNRLQTHPSIMQCRFWGMINGLKASYFIVEAALSNSEYEARLLQMEKEIQDSLKHQNTENSNNPKVPPHIGPELTPGAVGWENYPKEELLKMQPQVLPVPLVKKIETFDIPPEPLGRGINRYSYFVVNSLTDDWIELPILTPKQISSSRDIKKFFTGDLEEDIVSYPCFNGKEKHYLRAMIARITAGTYIAPKNYYRKMTKKEKLLFEGKEEDSETDDDDNDDDDDETDEKNDEEKSQITEEGEKEGEEKQSDNDIILLKNEKYDPSVSVESLNDAKKWVHVRPNILSQGRVVWYNQEEEKLENKKERNFLEKGSSDDDGDDDSHDDDDDDDDNANDDDDNNDDVDDDDDDDDDENKEKDLDVQSERGPAILNPCSEDVNSEVPVPWVGRFTSKFTNKSERILVMQSNVWPGAYTFVFRDLCDSIYLGWGHKAVARNMAWKHLDPIQDEYKHNVDDFIEAVDPTVEMEQAYQLNLLKKELEYSQMDEYDELESQDSSDGDDDDEYDDEEEEEEE